MDRPSVIALVVIFKVKHDDPGYLLYFRGAKVQTVVRKYAKNSKLSRRVLLGEALVELRKIIEESSLTASLRVIDGKSGAPTSITALESMTSIPKRSIPIPMEDPELYQYLYQSSQVDHSKNPRSKDTPVPLATAPYEEPDSNVMVSCSDASISGDHIDKIAAGTGWVIGLPGTESVTGSKRYAPREVDFKYDTSKLELHGIADSLEHAIELEPWSMGVTKIVHYCDNVDSVRSILHQDSIPRLFHVAERSHSAIRKLQSNGVSVEVQWTRGHADNEWNHIAHRMANVGRSGPMPEPAWHDFSIISKGTIHERAASYTA